MNTILAKSLNWEKEHDYLDLDINEVVESASGVIAPLGPVRTFAARSPWAGLEDQPFEQIARRLKGTCDVDIYPNETVLQTAWKQGEIDQHLLKKELHKWLDSQQLMLASETAERYCLNALLDGKKTSFEGSSSELKNLVKKLSQLKLQLNEKHNIQTNSFRLEQMGKTNSAQELNNQMIKWSKLYLDESQAVWTMPNREKGFYQAWRKLIQYDPGISRSVRKQLKNQPENAEEGLKEALSSLGVPLSEVQNYLEAHLLSLPGWAGMILWRSQQTEAEGTLLTEYLAVRLTMELVLVKPYLPLPEERADVKPVLEQLIKGWEIWGNMPIQEWPQLSSDEQRARLILAYRFDEIFRNRILLEVWEKTYEEQLKRTITAKMPVAAKQVKPVKAQIAFCIDVRSEPFRRKLENAGPFETFGTAGFFGLPIQTCRLDSNHSHNSLPVMAKPQFKIKEVANDDAVNSYQQRSQTANSISSMFKELKSNMLSSLLLPEISGPWLSMQTLGRSFIPRKAGRSFRKLRDKWLQKPSSELSLNRIEHSGTELPIGFTEEEKVHFARQALKMMNMTDHFAPLVVISGHGSHSTNNPYASSLDCGACGGASSSFNARVLAELCNLPEVREALAKEGIMIPKETVFVAAEHITSLDELRWVYVPELSKPAREAFENILSVLPKVSEEANAERIQQLPNIAAPTRDPKEEAERFAEDWSEVRPEWGLARNAAFIIGGRRLTHGSNLEGRVFLQNYNWRKDKNGTLLNNIITGPATVAQWINLQYYASTVAPHYYGSGNKATQTVTSGLGVMQGNASDLLSGLPWQSVMQSDQEAYHSPLRLLVVIQAPREHVKRMLDHVPSFQQKVQNGWIRLASIGPDGHWESWS